MKLLLFTLYIASAFGTSQLRDPSGSRRQGTRRSRYDREPFRRAAGPRPEAMEISGPTDLIGGKRSTAISNVSRPTMTVYSPQVKNTGVAVVVFPGGGYRSLPSPMQSNE